MDLILGSIAIIIKIIMTIIMIRMRAQKQYIKNKTMHRYKIFSYTQDLCLFMYTSEFSWNLRRFIYNTQITVSLRHRHQFTPYSRLSSWPSFLTHYHWAWAMWANERSLKGLTWCHTPANLSPNSQLPEIRMRTCLQATHSWLYKWHTWRWLAF